MHLNSEDESWLKVFSGSEKLLLVILGHPGMLTKRATHGQLRSIKELFLQTQVKE